MSDELYISTLLAELKAVLRDVRDNASLYSKEELLIIQGIAQELDETVRINLEADNFFDC